MCIHHRVSKSLAAKPEFFKILSVSKVAPCLRQIWTVSKINTIPSLCAKLFEITQLEEQHWKTSIQKKAKETQSMAV